MAKGKKSSGKHYVSSGERQNVSKKSKNAVRASRTPLEKQSAQVAAWKKGKRVMLTIANPNDNETNKRFIRVEARTVWGNPNQELKMPSLNEQMSK